MFEAPASLSVQAAPAGGSGVEASVEVAFEPSSLGEALRDTLILSSPTAGARAQPPRPGSLLRVPRSRHRAT